MGLLDSVVGALAGGGGNNLGGAAPDLLRVVVGMLANSGGGGAAPGGGGAADLVRRFEQGGLGDLVASWVGTGANLPVSGDQLGQVLGGDQLGRIAAQLGVSQGDAAGQLAQWLPVVLDKLTPDGQLPQGGLGDAGELLGRLLGAR